VKAKLCRRAGETGNGSLCRHVRINVECRHGHVNKLTASLIVCHDSHKMLQEVSTNLEKVCGLVVRVPGYTTEMYCVSCEVRTEFIYVM
jgi:hypothetical protein